MALWYHLWVIGQFYLCKYDYIVIVISSYDILDKLSVRMLDYYFPINVSLDQIRDIFEISIPYKFNAPIIKVVVFPQFDFKNLNYFQITGNIN